MGALSLESSTMRWGRMNRRAFLNLLSIEYRRYGPRKTSLVLMLGVVSVALVASGNTTLNGLAFLLATAGTSLFMLVPATVLKDKMSGTMDFLVSLPTTASVLVGARFTAAIFFAAAGAVLVGTAAGLGLPPLLGPVEPVRVAGLAFLVTWATTSALACAAIALLIRFNVSALVTYGPLIFVAAVFVAAYIYERLFGHPLDLIRAVMASERAPYVIGAILILATAGVLVASFLLARRAVENYLPQPDSIDW